MRSTAVRSEYTPKIASMSPSPLTQFSSTEASNSEGDYFPVAAHKRHGIIHGDVVFMYPPVGVQKVNMGRALFDGEPAYRQAIMDCAAVAAPFLPMALDKVLYPEAPLLELARSMIDQACFAQPCIFAVSHALTKLFESRQVFPTAVIGHSIGEYAAAVAAGVMDMPTAMTLVCERARLMHQLPAMGAMVSVRASRETCEAAMRDAADEGSMTDTKSKVAIAAINGPSTTVISGDWRALVKVISALPLGTHITKVNASHADHSPLTAPIHDGLRTKCQALFAKSPPSTPAIAMVSTVTGVAAGDDITSPEYWVQHTASPVLFADGFMALLEPESKVETETMALNYGGHHHRLFVEMGTGLTLSMARSVCGEDDLVCRGIMLEACLSKGTVSDKTTFRRCLKLVRDRMRVAHFENHSCKLMHGWVAGAVLLHMSKPLRCLDKRAMTLLELANETCLGEGPLAISLRMCRILGYLHFDTTSGKYSTKQGWKLDELASFLADDSPVADALRRIYKEAVPPFKIPSAQASLCLQAWTQHHGASQKMTRSALATLLDGVILAPLILSITYSARMDEQGMELSGWQKSFRFDASLLGDQEKITMQDIIEDVLKIGIVNDQGIVLMTSRGSDLLSQWYSYYGTAAFAPMISQFPHLLCTKPGSDCAQSDRDVEQFAHSRFAMVGNDVLIENSFVAMMRCIDAVFGTMDLNEQPKFVVCADRGSGRLLLEIFQYVKQNTRRGQFLNKFPLIMVGIAVSEADRKLVAKKLTEAQVPHLVVVADIGSAAAVAAELNERRVDLGRTLHVRAFADSRRKYHPPLDMIPKGSAVAAFVRDQMPDLVHLDEHGEPIAPADVFASQVEHFQRWSDVLEGSAGICVLDTMSLDSANTRRSMEDGPAFHLDMVNSLAGHYMIPAPAFALSAAMAGLLPESTRDVHAWPHRGNYCDTMITHLAKRAYKIRLAELSDLPQLEELEEAALEENLRVEREVLKARLMATPTTNLVCTLADEVVAALYMQRVADLSAVDQAKYQSASDKHSPTGKFLYFIAITAHPGKAPVGISTQLRAFALHLAHLEPTIDSVVAVARASHFKGSGLSMQEHVDQHMRGSHFDSNLGFHTDFGAKIRHLLQDYRPEDVDNKGIGVLVQYNIHDMSTIGPNPHCERKEEGKNEGDKLQKLEPTVSPKDILVGVLSDIGIQVKENDPTSGFFEYGISSNQVVEIRDALACKLKVDLPQTVIYDYPSVQTLCAFLEREFFSRAPSPVSKGSPSQSTKSHEVQEEPEVAPMSLERLIAINRDFLRVFSRADWQREFVKVDKETFPDKTRYLASIKPYIEPAMGRIIKKHGHIKNSDPETVHAGLIHVNEMIMKYWQSSKVLQRIVNRLSRVLRQGVLGSGISDYVSGKRAEARSGENMRQRQALAQ